MDVKQYYRKINEIEAAITEQFPIVVSLDTSDGGRAGLLCEVPRAIAAKMIVEARAALASESDKQQYIDQQLTAKKAAEKAELSRRLQIAIISDTDLKALSMSRKSTDPTSGK